MADTVVFKMELDGGKEWKKETFSQKLYNLEWSWNCILMSISNRVNNILLMYNLSNFPPKKQKKIKYVTIDNTAMKLYVLIKIKLYCYSN